MPFFKYEDNNKIIIKIGGKMLNQFSRSQLLFGKDNMEILKNAKILIFGVGGVGGYVCEALARSGIFNFTIVDDDKVCTTNINRQIIANFNTVGKYKVDVMKERILSINPNALVDVKKCFYLPTNKDEFIFKDYDYIVDCVDTVTAKISIIMEAQSSGVKIISAMGAGNKMHPEMLEVSDIYKTSVDPLARVMRYELRKRNVKKLKVVYSKEKPIKPYEDMSISCRLHCICPAGTRKCIERRDIPGSNAFVPSTMGLIIAAEIIKDLINYKD